MRSLTHPPRIRLAWRLLAFAALAGAAGARAGTLRVWCHQGQEAENGAMRGIAAAFEAAHAGAKVDLSFFPDFQYGEKVLIAAAAGDLPDCLDIDGPQVARFAAAGLLAPLDPLFSKDDLRDFLPTIVEQGTVDGRLYAMGAFDSAMVLYYDRGARARAGGSPPPDGGGWTWAEFLEACRRLKAAGMEPVALHMNEGSDEWFTYAFSPVVWSAGGSLIADDGRTVRGVLDSEANIRALAAWRRLFAEGLASADPVDPDPFGHGGTAMDWDGHWMARSHMAAKGAALGAMPLPRTGPRFAAPCGSWCWAVSSRAANPDAAADWIRWVTARRTGVDPIVAANGAVPARKSAFADFPEYARPPYSLFRAELEGFARPRPRTPFYAVLTQGFARALRDIAHGAAPGARLHEAAGEVQASIDWRTGTQTKGGAP
jgi:multiple sugar transport system substrate-binding protein